MEGEDERPGRNASDAVADVIAALRRAASGGPGMLDALLRQPDAARTVEAVLAMLGRGGRQEQSRPVGDGGTSAGAGAAADAIGFMGQAYMIAAASGFRFWRRVAETAAEHQMDVLRAMGDGRAQGDVVDGLRAYARELGDLSLQEARLFQAELDELAMSLTTTEAGEYRRRWRTKP